MTYGDVCTGISAATVAWAPMGWKPVFYSEIEPFPCKLLKHYYPTVPNLGDMIKIHENEYFQQCTIDVLVGGTPCQDFSVAGLRAGLSGDRGSLALEYCRILVTKRPRWFVWENVPGALSSYSNAEGEEWEKSDFAEILSAFRECGYCCAYRVLDAQYFGVPQRRRRIFVVGYLGDDWRPPAAVLFEPESVFRDLAPGRKTRKETAGTLDARTKGGGFPGSDGAMNGHIVACLDASYAKLQGASGQDLNHNHSHLIAYPYNQISSKANRSNPLPGDPCPTLTKDNRAMVVPAVRRLTPLECERLQGFPEIIQKIRLDICIDHQKKTADVAILSHKWQKYAWNVEEEELQQSVRSANLSSNTNQVDREQPAVLSALHCYEDRLQEIHNQGKLIWSAPGAEDQEEYPQPIVIGSIAQEIVQLQRELGSIALNGKVELLQSIRLSIQAKNGGGNAKKSGENKLGSAKGAETDHQEARFITLNPGQNIHQKDWKIQTLCCSVLNAINGSIQNIISKKNFCIDLIIQSPYTNIPGASDTARYKAIGNSMAVPVMDWIGNRIDMVDKYLHNNTSICATPTYP